MPSNREQAWREGHSTEQHMAHHRRFAGITPCVACGRKKPNKVRWQCPGCRVMLCLGPCRENHECGGG